MKNTVPSYRYLAIGILVVLILTGSVSAYGNTMAGHSTAGLPLPQEEEIETLNYLPLVAQDRLGPSPEHQMIYGAVVAEVRHLPYVRQLGFTWAQVFIPWASVEPEEEGEPRWEVVNNLVESGRQYNVHLLARVDRPPDWAREPGTSATGPVRNTAYERWAAFLEELALRGRGVIGAYVLWNEPNLSIEWGGQRPNPAKYAEMLRVAYPAIKRGDPNAIVIAAAMATTGPAGDQPTHMDDLLYIERMYHAGAKGFFDGLGTNPHGFGRTPETDPNAPGINGLTFRRVEQQRAIMERFGDGDRGMWAMEVGWLAEPGPACYPIWEREGRLWQKVSVEQQRDYLVRAYRYAQQHWPWMKAMLVFNLDFGAVGSEAGCPGATNLCRETRYYALITSESPCTTDPPLYFRPAFEALQTLPKP